MEPPTVLRKTVLQQVVPVTPFETRAGSSAVGSTELDHRPLGPDDEPTAMPEAGGKFAGFTLIRELGRGAFGRAYLARQADLSDRPVVLKVSPDAGKESRTLALLQHPNIVPVHSVHRVGTLQAICMPYFGAATLADVRRERFGLSGEIARGLNSTVLVDGAPTLPRDADGSAELAVFDGLTAGPPVESDLRGRLARGESVEAVLWLAARLADGLAHAHGKGIVHRDLKPANVLVTDDGRPMLFDFNLAGPAKGKPARMGGTLPYMSPEQLEAFAGQPRTVDHRTDLYSLGVILYELLTGRHPFPLVTPVTENTPSDMARDRQGPPPRLRPWNRRVSPAVESIVRHCLQADPDERYQSARELCEDLARHAAHRPLRYAPESSVWERLRKWRRRHPLAPSAVGAGLTALIVLGMQVVRYL
jgi:serine/threonine protein kinase